MAALAERLGLKPDEFAFHFETNVGVDADALAVFLQRAATVARRSGADLRVVGSREGSLNVVIKAFKKSVLKEYTENPAKATREDALLVTAIVGAIVAGMTYFDSGPAPIAKSGARIIENHNVTQIAIFTDETNVVVMDKEKAAAVRAAEEAQKLLNAPDTMPRLSAPVAGMLRDARSGDLSGETSVVQGELHFRPDGYRFWVPIDENPTTANGVLKPGGRYRISGHIALLEGQPDRIVVERATLIFWLSSQGVN